MNSNSLKKPLLLRQIRCKSLFDCPYDIDHLHKRLLHNPTFTAKFKEYIDEGRYADLYKVIKEDKRFDFLWK
tara:strand:- start:589 stop:804 length:216 start_codon:yes stop_codon:yes gene_type:complete